jgi:hypothetical protein
MSQQFAKDAQYLDSAPINIVNAVRTPLLRTNALTPPFGNCKAVIKATFCFAPDAAATDIDIFIVRNPDGENITLIDNDIQFAAPAAGDMIVTAMATDQIPDGRDVTYEVQATQSNGVGTGQVFNRFIEAELISG